MNKNELMIVIPSHGFFYKYIKELGYSVCDPYYGKLAVLRIFRELHFRLKLPGSSIWYNRRCICNQRVIVLYGSLLTGKFIKWLQKKNNSSVLIMIYANPVATSINPDSINKSEIILWTYDKDDAEKYGMNLISGGIYFPQWKVKKEKAEYDVFYIGKDKGRLQRLREIEARLNDYGLKTFFYITWSRGWQHKDDGIHKPFLPYEDVLDYIGKSKAILHLLDGSQHGVTLRIQESLIHKVKLITDDSSIVNYDFYNPNNIFILGKDDLKGLRHFLDSPYEDIQTDFFKHAFYEQMLDEVVKISIQMNDGSFGD